MHTATTGPGRQEIRPYRSFTVNGQRWSTLSLERALVFSSPNYTGGSVNGTLKIDPKPATAAVTAGAKTYDGTTTATISACTLSSGVIAADAGKLTCSAGTATFASANVATGITVTATGITLSGSAASNYLLSSTSATTTASINPAAPALALTCTEVTYDGNPHSCTGSAIGVSGAAVTGSWSLSPMSETNVGSYPVTGTFTSGDSNYVSGGTASGTLRIIDAAPATSGSPDFSLPATPPSVTVKAGQSQSSSLTVTPANGFTGTVSFTCAVGSTMSEASCFATSVQITGTSPVTSTLTAPHQAAAIRAGGNGLYG